MLDLELTQAEEVLLREMLDSEISDLHEEIAHTDRFEYREALKERRRVLQKVLDALPPALP
jgi:hypothetical protein